MTIIYKIENLVNRRTYVGSTSNTFNRRVNQHRSLLRMNKHKNPHLQNAWNKYGGDNFEFTIIENCGSGLRLQREEHHKNRLKSEYNIAPIVEPFGCLNRGRKLSLEHRASISRGNLGKHLSQKHKDAIRASRIGSHHSEETRKKISVVCKGKTLGLSKPPFSLEHLKNLSVSHIGINQSSAHYKFGGRYHFFHPLYGDEILGQCEWSRKYNGSKQGKISLLCLGRRKSYKGWVCKGKSQ